MAELERIRSEYRQVGAAFLLSQRNTQMLGEELERLRARAIELGAKASELAIDVHGTRPALAAIEGVC